MIRTAQLLISLSIFCTISYTYGMEKSSDLIPGKNSDTVEYYVFRKNLLSQEQEILFELIDYDQHCFANPINIPGEPPIKPIPLPNHTKKLYAEKIDALVSQKEEPYLYRYFMNKLYDLPNALPKPIPLLKNQLTIMPSVTPERNTLTTKQNALITRIMDRQRTHRPSFGLYNELLFKLNEQFPKAQYPDHYTMLYEKLTEFRIDHALSMISFPMTNQNSWLSDNQKITALNTLTTALTLNTSESKRYCAQQLYDIQPLPSLMEYPADPKADHYFAQTVYPLLKIISNYNAHFTPQAYYEYKTVQKVTKAMKKEVHNLRNFSIKSTQKMYALNTILTSIIDENDEDLATDQDLNIIVNEKCSQFMIDSAIRTISCFSENQSERDLIDSLAILSRKARIQNTYCLNALSNAQPIPGLLEYKTNLFFANKVYPFLTTLSEHNVLFTPQARTDYESFTNSLQKLTGQNKIKDIPLETIQQLKEQDDLFKYIIPNEELSWWANEKLESMYKRLTPQSTENESKICH